MNKCTWLALIAFVAVGATIVKANAGDRTESCSSYTTGVGVTHETCRSPGRKERECTSYTSITGATHTECR